jgi:hypothetical protein
MMTDDIRRHSNGCIDFDFCRAEAIALRRQARGEAGFRLGAATTAMMSGAIGFATVTPAAMDNDSVVAARIAPTRAR